MKWSHTLHLLYIGRSDGGEVITPTFSKGGGIMVKWGVICIYAKGHDNMGPYWYVNNEHCGGGEVVALLFPTVSHYSRKVKNDVSYSRLQGRG